MKTSQPYWKIVLTAAAITWTTASLTLAQGNVGGAVGNGTTLGSVPLRDLSGGNMTTLSGNTPSSTPGNPSYATPYTTPGYNNPNTLGVPGGVNPTYPNPGALGTAPPGSYSPPSYGAPNIFRTPGRTGSRSATNPFSASGSLGYNTSPFNNPYILTPGSIGVQPLPNSNPLATPGSSSVLTTPNANPFGSPGSTSSSSGSR